MTPIQYNQERIKVLEKLIADTRNTIPNLKESHWIRGYYKNRLSEYELELRERKALEERR